eukprot:6408418-Prymnesium_polylepis.1
MSVGPACERPTVLPMMVLGRILGAFEEAVKSGVEGRVHYGSGLQHMARQIVADAHQIAFRSPHVRGVCHARRLRVEPCARSKLPDLRLQRERSATQLVPLSLRVKEREDCHECRARQRQYHHIRIELPSNVGVSAAIERDCCEDRGCRGDDQHPCVKCLCHPLAPGRNVRVDVDIVPSALKSALRLVRIRLGQPVDACNLYNSRARRIGIVE